MVFVFDKGSQGDLVLQVGNRWHNLGYKYHFYLPMTVALAEHQCGRGDILARITVPEINLGIGRQYEPEEELERVLSESRTFFQRLPLPEDQFNRNLPFELKFFYNGGNSMQHQFRVENSLLVLENKARQEEVVRLDGPCSAAFLEAFLQYVDRDVGLGVYRGMVKRTLSEIKVLQK